MSYNECKTVLRVEIPELNDKSVHESYQYFLPILGEPYDVDEWNGVVQFFEYNEMKHDYIPVRKYGKNDRHRWGIDYILSYGNDYGETKGKTNHSLVDLLRIADEMAVKFHVNSDRCRLLSYSWYNGVDEPIDFE